MSPGDVVWLEFPGVAQTKRRPAVVLSTPAYHATRPDIIVGLVTTQIAKATSSTAYLIRDWRAAGLHLPSAFRAFITTLPRSTVLRKMGALVKDDWIEVVARVEIAVELK